MCVGGGRPRAEGKEEKLILRLLTTRQLEDLHLSRRLLPAIFTSTSHFFSRRLTGTATHLQMIHVAGRIWADVGGASPSEKHSSGGKMDPLFIKDLLFALYAGEPEAEGFSIGATLQRMFFFFFSLWASSESKD